MDIVEASRDNWIEHIKKLIKEGTDINKTDKVGWTALIWASKCGRLEIAKELLKCPGININTVDKWGWSALMDASNHDNLEIVKELLKCNDINVYITDVCGQTALLIAKKHCNFEIVKILEEHMMKDLSFLNCIGVPDDIIKLIVTYL